MIDEMLAFASAVRSTSQSPIVNDKEVIEQAHALKL